MNSPLLLILSVLSSSMRFTVLVNVKRCLYVLRGYSAVLLLCCVVRAVTCGAVGCSGRPGVDNPGIPN